MQRHLASFLVVLLLLAPATARSDDTIVPASELGLQLGPDTTVVSAPLDQYGYPDYIEALNERLSAGVSRDENFWVLMWPAIGNAERTSEDYLVPVEQRLGITISREPRIREPYSFVQAGSPEFEQLDKQYQQASQRPWTREEFPDIARALDANEEVLREVHAACLRPKTFAPLIVGSDTPVPMVAVLLPHVQAQRSVGRLLAARAMLRLGEGDIEGSWQDLLDMYRLARHTERGWTLIESLVGYAIRGIALQPTVHWIAACGLTPEALSHRWSELLPLLKIESLARTIDTERFMFIDTVLALSSRRGQSRELLSMISGTPVSREEQGPVLFRGAEDMLFHLMFVGSDVNSTLRYGNRTYDNLVSALQPASHAERLTLLKGIEDRIKQDAQSTRDPKSLVKTFLFSSREELNQIPGKTLTALLVPAVISVENAQTRTETNAALLHAALLVQQHLSNKGELPLSLSEIPGSDSAGLVDPYSTEPLRLVIDNRGLVVYSVGRDGVDNAGKNNDESHGCDDLRVILPVAP